MSEEAVNVEDLPDEQEQCLHSDLCMGVWLSVGRGRGVCKGVLVGRFTCDQTALELRLAQTRNIC